MPLLPGNWAQTRPERDRDLRVLIVDDHVVVRGALRSGLETIDRAFTIIEAETGDEALQILTRVPIDVVFADILLPGLSGPEALAQAFPKAESRPFMVLISASKDVTSIREIGRRLGAYEFLSKPFRPKDIQRVIRSFERLEEGTRVLLVDDSQTARRLMARILDRSRFNILLQEAGSGSEALRLARGELYDVIFCDLNMPDMSGMDTSAALRRMNPGTRIVMISTEADAPKLEEAQKAGVFAFLQKPFDNENVDAILHEALAMARPSLVRPSHALIYEAAKKSGRNS